MSNDDIGGDPACWTHLFEDDDVDTSAGEDGVGLVVDLSAESPGPSGAVWSLPHGGDLDANLVRLDPGVGIDAHVNNEVDVLVSVRSGSAHLTIDGHTAELGPDHLALIPKGSRRTIVGGADGVIYLSIHRRRDPLSITKRPGEPPS